MIPSTLTTLPTDSPIHHDHFFHDQHFSPNIDSDSDIENESPPEPKSHVIPSQSVPLKSQPVSIQVVDSQPSSSIESHLLAESTY